MAASSSSSVEVGYVVLIGPPCWESSCQPRGHEPRPPGQVGVVAYLLPVTRAAEHRGRALPLGVRVLHADDSPGPEQQGGPALDDPDRVEAVAGGVERELGVVV